MIYPTLSVHEVSL